MLLEAFLIANIIINIKLCVIEALTRKYSTETDNCPELSEDALTVVLGQAFNPRYMSIMHPRSNSEAFTYGSKRSSNIPFYADRDVISVGDYPAWETNHISYFEVQDKAATKDIHKRNVHSEKSSEIFKTRPWECTSRIKWIDLGINYFPRYVRSIECISSRCWYGHFHCKPKSFTIKVLRRKVGSCVRVSDKLIMLASISAEQIFTELWIWEEIVINFCCDCVMIY